ncbi:hypothetical protein M2155_002076 [Streptomyces sp. SAI-119]|uniref:hypothetical protein n=1 Tax=Streptomyces sp. SAI-119 TaxID=2940541 RepID=UPI0024764F55|nr:hypothetical protein [Streptomyces sp. SAI-119]MDH6449668.1 hypothetical protein [Streptomyces sp. SAI-119]
MAGTTRTRKNAAAQPAEAGDTPVAETEKTTAEPTGDPATAAAAAEESPAVETSPQAPDVAPLEPPAVHEAPEPPAEPGYVSPTEVIPDDIAEVILDDATKQPPADIDAVFQPVTPHGSAFRCTVRLIERTYVGPHSNPIERLLQPKGAHVSESIAARIRERLVAQADATSTEK